MNVNVITPTGEIGNIPEADLPNALKYGYRLASEKEVQHEVLREEYGQGFGNELVAGVEGALSGATFGASRHIANELGITTPEAQAARKQFNPAASMAGEIAGIAGSALLIPGGGAVGLLGRGTMRAGEALVGGVATNQIAKQIAARTVGSALEGMAYGAGQAISEKALGDPTLTAQKVFHQIGIGGLLGGGLGFATAALGAGARKLISSPVAKAVDEPIEAAAAPGSVDFGMPDSKLLSGAEKINPRNPLKAKDLEWLKQNGMPDANGKPTIFSKIGTEEIPTLDPLAEGQVTMTQATQKAMGEVAKKGRALAAARDEALEQSGLTLRREEYQQMIAEQLDDVLKSGKAGDEIGQSALAKLRSTLEASENLPENMTAMQIKDRLDAIRQSGRIYTKSGGIKDDFVSETYKGLEKTIDKFLKKNIPAYEAVQKEYAPFVKNSIEIEDYLKWNPTTNTSDLVIDWATNRIAKPFQGNLPGTEESAKLVRWLGDVGGVDFEKAAKANFIFGKINPAEAAAGQQGSWGARVLEGMEALSRPTEIPGKVLTGAAKMVLSGEMRAKGVQKLLLGKASNPGVIESILGKIGGAGPSGSALLNAGERISPLGVPLGVTGAMPQFLDSLATLDEADEKLEILLALEKAKIKADKAIDANIRGIFSDSGPRKEKGEENALFKKTTDELADEMEKVSADVNEMLSNPELLLDRLSNSMAALGTYAPNIAGGVSMTASRALNFLSGKLSSIMPQDKLPLDKKFVPSRNQLSSLEKTMRYINSPFDVLSEIRSGTVSPEGKDVLTNVYPELYDELKAAVLNGISEAQAAGKKIPMSKQWGLSIFTGQPLSSSMNAKSMLANQMSFAAPQPTQNAPNPRPAGAKNLGLSTRAMTPLQKIAGR